MNKMTRKYTYVPMEVSLAGGDSHTITEARARIYRVPGEGYRLEFERLCPETGQRRLESEFVGNYMTKDARSLDYVLAFFKREILGQ